MYGNFKTLPKKGDKVRCISREGSGGYKFGEVYILRKDAKENYYGASLYTEVDSLGSTTNGWSIANFEPVEEAAADTIESLMEQYNALRVKIHAHPERTRLLHSAFPNSSVGSWDILYTLKPKKPAFEPFQVSLGKVELKRAYNGLNVQIGCTGFEVVDLVRAFRHFDDGRTGGFSIAGLTATAVRNGIHWNGYSLPWAEVDMIHSALKKAGY